MKILYDGQMFCMQKAGGINRYFTELISRLPGEYSPVISLTEKRSIIFPKHGKLEVKSYPFLNSWPRGLWSRLEPFYASVQAAGCKADVYHPTFYKALTRKKNIKTSCPMVVTVWDLLHMRYPEQLDPDGAWGEQIKRTILSADALLCISTSTRNDLLKFYPVNPDKVYVTPLASSLKPPAVPSYKDTDSLPYYLFVGGRNGYKNFSTMLKAFSLFKHNSNGTQLYVVGEDFTHDEMIQINSLKLDKKVKLFPHITDDKLSELYNQSIALVYPSEYEGFGLPPLEAMTCGTTVIASKSSSLPEVVGGGGLLVDPSNAEELAGAMETLQSDRATRDSLLVKAKAQSELYSWERVAEKTCEVYRALV